MFISGPWMMSAVETVGGEGFADKYSVMTMPEKETSSSFVGGSNLAVFKDSENRDSAWKLVQWLSEPETQAKWYGISTDLPAVSAAWEDPALSGDEKLATFGTQLETAKAPPSFATWEAGRDRFRHRAGEGHEERGGRRPRPCRPSRGRPSPIGTGQ